MARERQQYSGDLGHELNMIRYAFGEYKLIERYIRTFSDGLSKERYFMDCWPAYDRMARIAQRQMGLSQWGPIIDHGIGFVMDCYDHYYYTGQEQLIISILPKLKRFGTYLEGMMDAKGLLSVEDIGIPCVWIDHYAYKKQKHKKCAFNLYAVAMLKHALAPICQIGGNSVAAERFEKLAEKILKSTQSEFWSHEQHAYVNNLPWKEEEKELRYCDRSLAIALIYDLCPDKDVNRCIEILEIKPENMGLSYPCNAIWRYRALARYGKMDTVIGELKKIWANMDSVILNNTYQEDWEAKPDSKSQWSHSAAAPLSILFAEIAGIKPLKPGFEDVLVQPQLYDMED